jgi:hypothetical protein
MEPIKKPISLQLTNEERLQLKCAHLEFTLEKERAQQAIRDKRELLDNMAEEIFNRLSPAGSIRDFTLDLEKGVFNSKEVTE